MSENHDKYKRIDNNGIGGSSGGGDLDDDLNSNSSNDDNDHGLGCQDGLGGVEQIRKISFEEEIQQHQHQHQQDSSYRKLTVDPNKFPSSFKFILGNEAMERFSYYGIKTILILYLTNFMNYEKDKATSILHSFNFLAYLFPILGAWIADTKIGKFKTILIFSIIYVIGGFVLSITAIPGVTGSNEEGSYKNPWGIIIGLGLIAAGTGGIKSNVPTFAADQLQSNQNQLLEKLFQIFYWCINLGSLASTLLIPILRVHFSYMIAFLVPAIFLTIATIVFIIGNKHYKKRPISESIIWTLLQVVGYSLKEKFKILKSKYKRNGKGMLYTNPYTSNISDTNWLDLSKITYDSQLVDSIKAALNVLLLFIPMIGFWAIFDQTGSRWVLQAASLNTCLFGNSVCIEPDQIQALNPIFVMTLIPFVEFAIYKPLKRMGFNFKPLYKMGIGMILSAISFLIAMFLQIAIDKSIIESNSGSSGNTIDSSVNNNNEVGTITNISIWWLLPQYVVLTLGEILVSITGLEFAYANAPSSMKSIIMSGWLMSISLGNIFVVFVVDGISFSKQWVEFLFFSSVMLLFTLLFILIAYKFKPTDISVTQYNDDNPSSSSSNNQLKISSMLPSSASYSSLNDCVVAGGGGNNLSVMILTDNFNDSFIDDHDDYRSSIELESNLI